MIVNHFIVQNNQLEQQIARIKAENQTLGESLNIQSDRAQRLSIELEESERSRKVIFKLIFKY